MNAKLQKKREKSRGGEEIKKILSYGETEEKKKKIKISSVVSGFGRGVYIKDRDDTNWTLGSLWTETTK